jgi:2'-5' RNA ligase
VTSERSGGDRPSRAPTDVEGALSVDLTDDRPLVLTLRLDAPTQARFDRERASLFPPGRTAVGAHVTLFHALPGSMRRDVEAVLDARRTVTPFPVTVTEPFSLGRGVAYRLRSPELDDLHRELQARWRDALTPQDRQRFRAHVTVQNKVAAERARETLDRLRVAHVPVVATGLGLELWRYDGGPWTPLGRYDFDGAGAALRTDG